MRLNVTLTNTRRLLLFTLVALVFGCSKPGDNKSASSKNGPEHEVETTAEKSNVPTPQGSTPRAPAAIATADGETSGTRVDVTELKRSSDNTVTLKFAMANDSDKQLNFGYAFGDEANQIKDFASIGGITLIDGTNKKKYFVVRDTENNCVCSRGLKDMAAHSRANLWAKFPAPPDDVQKISIVIPHFGPLDDVPISR